MFSRMFGLKLGINEIWENLVWTLVFYHMYSNTIWEEGKWKKWEKGKSTYKFKYLLKMELDIRYFSIPPDPLKACRNCQDRKHKEVAIFSDRDERPKCLAE